jgi:hypothetical protein
MIATKAAEEDHRDPVTIPAPPPSGSYVVSPSWRGLGTPDARAETGSDAAAEAYDTLPPTGRDTDPAPPPCDLED